MQAANAGVPDDSQIVLRIGIKLAHITPPHDPRRMLRSANTCPNRSVRTVFRNASRSPQPGSLRGTYFTKLL
jgi:hypothetical protein